MSVCDIPEEAQMMALNPPVFDASCVQCGLWRRVLPWQIAANGTWGAVCGECGKSILVRQLRLRMLGPFARAELFEKLLTFGLPKKEAELLIGDFEREGTIALVGTSYCWCEPRSMVKSISERRVRKHLYQRKTAGEIFRRCVWLSREIRRRTKM
jgi:hypothetical protein